MAALLALAAAATWGVADFLGGLTSRRADERTVAALSQFAGLAVLAVVVPLAGGSASVAALGWGALAGLGGAGGLVLYFRGLAIGPMGVTAPVSALTGAVVPVLAGLALGERPGPVAFLGIVVGVAATVLASRPAEEAVLHPDQSTGAPADGSRLRRGIVAAALAGVLFGLFFVALDQTPPDSGLWPLLGARVSGVTMLAVLLLRRRPGRPDRRALVVSLGVGVLDMAANTLFLLAARIGLLVLVSVLTSLYPVVLVLLARLVLQERLGRWQQVGVVLALVAVVLIAL